MAVYLEACLEEANGDAAFIAKALGDIARAKGMAKVARDAGLSRESLYKALSGDRSPGFDTILKVIDALGLTLHAKPADSGKRDINAQLDQLFKDIPLKGPRVKTDLVRVFLEDRK
jgi:probable addiction module antidote protein